MSKRVFFSLIFGLIALLIFLRWNSFTAPFERDEGEYAYSAWLLSKNIPPYEFKFILKPPLIIYTYLVGYLVNQEAVWPYRLIVLAFDIATVFLIGAIVKKLKDTNIAFWAMYLMVFMLNFYHFTFAANTERFMLVPLLGLLCLYVYFKRKITRRVLIFGGILGALAILYKPVCLLVVIAIYCAWLGNIRAKRKKIYDVYSSLLYLLVGFTATTALTFGYFLLRVRLDYLVEQLIIFNSYYAATFAGKIDYLLYHLGVITFNWFLLILVIILGLFQNFREKAFYLLLIILSLISIHSSLPGHYYLLIAPFLVIVYALSIDSLSQTRVIKLLVKPHKFIAVSSFLIILTVLPVNLIIVSLSPNQLVKQVYARDDFFGETKAASEIIKSRTSLRDYVFVYGSEPQINFYSKRLSPDRFVYLNYILWPTPFSGKYAHELVNSLNNNPPKIIVIVNTFPSFVPKTLSAYLEEKLRMEYELIGGFSDDEGIFKFFNEANKPDNIYIGVYERRGN